ncbi:MAG: hypothetical protein KDA24_24930 [Deltaproteobacteria bacterium]|nr:hypothetical protein [Deltaproteobacteria bacterium]
MRGLAPIAALLLLVIGSVGCPPKASKAPPRSDGEARNTVSDAGVAPTPEDRGQPARVLTSDVVGVELTLGKGWSARTVSGEGPVVARAWGPPRSGAVLDLIRWDGTEDSVAEILSVDPWAWDAEGPYTVIEGADLPPLVATFREVLGEDSSRDRIGFAWFFTVDGEGVGVVARVPATRMEAGFTAARGAVVSARAKEGS